jgi:hypothetical protein
MSADLDHQMRRVKGHLDAAADYARRAKNYANSEDTDAASSNIRKAADEIDNALALVNRIRRDLI